MGTSRWSTPPNSHMQASAFSRSLFFADELKEIDAGGFLFAFNDELDIAGKFALCLEQ